MVVLNVQSILNIMSEDKLPWKQTIFIFYLSID
jgi:hypothetical protein